MLFLTTTLLLIVFSITLAVIGFLPIFGSAKQTTNIIDTSFKLTPGEVYRQGLGSFHGDETISISVNQNTDAAIDFTLLTYAGAQYSTVSKTEIKWAFPAGADYYEVAFKLENAISTQVQFRASVTKTATEYPLAWLGAPAKTIFLIAWSGALMLILEPVVSNPDLKFAEPSSEKQTSMSHKKNLRNLKIGVLLSLAFWLILLAANSYPLATFENWYTDAARHPYTSTLFTKFGFSVFNTPLGLLSGTDDSVYKFVTWAEMPHLYPVGSIFLFLPFGTFLEKDMTQVIVFKFEMIFFIGVAHLCLYIFLKQFWKREMTFSPREFLSTHLNRKSQSEFVLKAAATYLLYVLLVIYAANGQFDSVALLPALIGLPFFLEERYDMFLLMAAIASTFKYQAGIFLLPLIMISMIRLFQKDSVGSVLRKKSILAAAGLAVLDLFTAALSMPYLMMARPELIMNSVNAFSPHAQGPWPMQFFAVMLTLTLTIVSSVYLISRSRITPLFMIFALAPAFMMPYFQPWYLPFFFVYLLVPQEKRSRQVTLVWIVFISFILAFGGLAYNPLGIFDSVRRILGL